MTYLFLVVVGVFVGVINGMAGGASIISYPALLAVGLNPLSAVVTNALGAMPANFLAVRHHKVSFVKLARENATLILASVIGTLIGAVLLLNMPIGTLEKLIPFLLLFATCTLLIPIPERPTGMDNRKEAAAIFGTGLYCGYFGPGQGVMVSATLARDARRSPSLLNATKNVIVGVTVVMSNIVYAVSGHVNWACAIALGIGAGIGGNFGGKWATQMSATFYRRLVFAVGICSTIGLFIKYY
jgi:uncharacterized membrane protein YfcA